MSSALADGRAVSHHSTLGVFLLSRVLTCGEGIYQLHFLLSKVDYKSWAFIFVISHLLTLVIRLVIIYEGSALTKGLRSFLLKGKT